MKIVTNPKKIQRNYKIGMYTSFAALIFLFGAVGLTFLFTTRPDLSNFSFLAMLVGLILSQVGVYFANRWGKSPRIDERLSQGLKGLDNQYTLYHYATAVPHLLVGPGGIWILAPQYHPGTITYEKNRYSQKGVGFFARFVGQESISRPDLEAESYQEDLQKFLKKSMADGTNLPIQSIIVFTNPKATVQAPDAPIPTMHVDKLKDFIRRRAKEQPANPQDIRRFQELLPQEDVD